MALMSSGDGLSGGKLALATATEPEVLSGKTFYSGDKKIKTGTMTDRGAWSSTISLGGSVVIPLGYHSGSGVVSADASNTIKEYIRVYSSNITGQGASITLVYYSNNVQSDSLIIPYTNASRTFHFLTTRYGNGQWTVTSIAVTGRANVSGSNMVIQNTGFNISSWNYNSSTDFVIYRVDVSGISGKTFPL